MVYMIKYCLRLLITQTFWRVQFGALGIKTTLFSPMMVVGPRHIFLGSNTIIRDYARLETILRPELGWTPSLKIGSRVNIEQGVHIICGCELVIENDVSIAPYCGIVDTYHPHNIPGVLPKDLPRIGTRLNTEKTFVKIGEGTLIGTQSFIMPNVRIGKWCVIGAGSVVNSDIPDYSVAIGSPARVISRFDIVSKKWQKVDEDSSHN